MARGINKVILIGNLGQDPELRYMPQGGCVAQLSLATSEAWTDKATNERKEQTEWHRVVIYNRLAEIAGEYARKGSKVYIEGKLRTRKWQDQQGVERYTTEIIAATMQLLDGATQNAGQQQPAQQAAMAQHQPRQTGNQKPARQPAPAGYQSQMGHNPNMPPPPPDYDDDFPI